MASKLQDLYGPVIMAHYRTPHHHGHLEGATSDVEMLSPTCGDEVRITCRIEGGRIADIRFEGRGCSISMASASMLTDAVAGKTVAEARALIASVREMLQGAGDGDAAALGDVATLRPVTAHYHGRTQCALLPWVTLEKGLDE